MKGTLLRWRLRRQGATPKDAKLLSDIARKLAVVSPGLSPEAKKRIARDIGFKPQHIALNYRLALSGAFATLAVLVVLAQSALPGSALYALKRGTEEVRVILQPGFDDNDLQQRREDEQNRVRENGGLEDKRTDGVGDTSGRDNRDTKSEDIQHDATGDSQRTDELKVDTSGHGSGGGDIPEINIDDGGSSGSSGDDNTTHN